MIVELIARKKIAASSLSVNARAKKAIYINEPRRITNDRVKPAKTNFEYFSEYASVLMFRGDHLHLKLKTV